MTYRIHYYRLSTNDRTVTEEFPRSNSPAFYARLIELFDDEDATITQITLGSRRGTILWGGMVELP
jgi:hypothetical protein